MPDYPTARALGSRVSSAINLRELLRSRSRRWSRCCARTRERAEMIIGRNEW